jgi:diacylglycerol kinase family enzyme
MDTMTIGAVINPRAGGVSDQQSEARLRAISRLLCPLLPAELRRVASGSQIAEAVEDLLERGANAILVGGGDGTVSSVAGIAARMGIVLGILPLGTRNHFARDLGMPLEMAEWPDIFRRLSRRRVDMGEVNGRPFVNNVSIGMYPRIVEERDRSERNGTVGRSVAQFSAAMRVAVRFPRSRCVLHFSKASVHCVTPILFVGNNEYEGGLRPHSRRPVLDSGQLWVCTARASDPLSLLRLFWRVCGGRLEKIEELDMVLAQEVRIEFQSARITAAIDGETCRLKTPLRLRSLQRALEVIVP